MPITRSDVAVFSTGIALGAVAYATYPKWKDKVAPLISAVMAGAAAAYHDANSRATEGGDGATVTDLGSPVADAHAAMRNGAGKVATSTV